MHDTICQVVDGQVHYSHHVAPWHLQAGPETMFYESLGAKVVQDE
jgi:hypothetical protein